MTIYAHTPASGYASYPPYINISANDEGGVTVIVRGSERKLDAGYMGEGHTVSIVLSRDEWLAMRRAVLGIPDSVSPEILNTVDFINSVPTAA